MLTRGHGKTRARFREASRDRFQRIPRVASLKERGRLRKFADEVPKSQHSLQRARSSRPLENADYFHVISIPKKCTNTCRFGRFFGFCCGLRI